MKKKLHELIQLAKEGKKFKAFYDEAIYDEKHFAIIIAWHWNAVVSDWQYQEIRDPEVVEFVLIEPRKIDPQLARKIPFIGISSDQYHKIMSKEKWKVVCIEVME